MPTKFESLGNRFLSKLNPETAHSVAKWFMKKRYFARGRYLTDESKTRLFDINLDNPFGIAAGFDKYAELHDVVKDYGFGFIESGSFTLNGGEGNPRPRLFRDEEKGGLINRMVLNCIDSCAAAERLSTAKDPYSFAVNIAKTHDPEIMGEKAIEDIISSYELLKNLGIYTAINISCPNTAEGKTFEDPGSFRELVQELDVKGKGRPLVFKFSPGLEEDVLNELVEISSDVADGYEAVNTLPFNHESYGKGGLSGAELKFPAIRTLNILNERLEGTEKTLLGCGGISTENEAYVMSEFGASAFLVYNGFVYQHEKNPYAGTEFAYKINEGFSELMR